jgi:hypothetical protein
VSSSEVNIPERLLRRGRVVDEHFDSSERLYHRCQLQHINSGRLLPQAIRFPNFSVNRSKYSQPEDVLLPCYRDWKIAAFEVIDIPEPQSTDKNTEYSWRVKHDPLDTNYAHSEVRTFKNSVYDENLKVPTTIKKQFRQILSDRARVIHEPRMQSENNSIG